MNVKDTENVHKIVLADACCCHLPTAVAYLQLEPPP